MRSVNDGVYFTKAAATNLIGLTTLHEMDISAIFHQGKVYLADSNTVTTERLSEFHILAEEDYKQGLPYVNMNLNPMKKTTTVASVRSMIVGRAMLIMTNARKNKLNNQLEQVTVTSLPPEVLQGGVHLARSYSSHADTDEGRWWKYHSKLGHPGSKVLQQTLELHGISAKETKKFCESCARGKIKSHAHKRDKGDHEVPLPGEVLKGDSEGPYASSFGGAKYRFFMKCAGSGAVFSRIVKSKTDFPKALREIVIEVEAKSGRKVRRTQLDGDGALTSKEIKRVADELRIHFTHSSPYDPQQNGLAENDVLNNDNTTRVIFAESGAPPYMWGAVMKYRDHTVNNLLKKRKDGTWMSPCQLLEGFKMPYDAKKMLPFGCLVIVQLRKGQLKGSKEPSRDGSYAGIFIGYGEDIGYRGSYIIWHAELRQARTASYNHCCADETNFPWKMHPRHRKEWGDYPLSYVPTRDAMLDPEESKRYDFTQEEENEVLNLLFGTDKLRSARSSALRSADEQKTQDSAAQDVSTPDDSDHLRSAQIDADFAIAQNMERELRDQREEAKDPVSEWGLSPQDADSGEDSENSIFVTRHGREQSEFYNQESYNQESELKNSGGSDTSYSLQSELPMLEMFQHEEHDLPRGLPRGHEGLLMSDYHTPEHEQYQNDIPVRRSQRNAGRQKPIYAPPENRERAQTRGEKGDGRSRKAKETHWITEVTDAKEEEGKRYVEVQWWSKEGEVPFPPDWLEETEVRKLGEISNGMVEEFYAGQNKEQYSTSSTTTPTETVLHTRKHEENGKIPQRRRDLLETSDLTTSSILDYVDSQSNLLVNHLYGVTDNFDRGVKSLVSDGKFDQKSKIRLEKKFSAHLPQTQILGTFYPRTSSLSTWEKYTNPLMAALSTSVSKPEKNLKETQHTEGIALQPGDEAPRGRKEAQYSNYWPQWQQAEHVEMDVHRVNGTWRLVHISTMPKGKRLIRTKGSMR